MDATGLRDPLEMSVGLAIGIGLVTLATGDWPGFGFALGIALIPVISVAFARLDGPSRNERPESARPSWLAGSSLRRCGCYDGMTTDDVTMRRRDGLMVRR